MAIIIPSSKIYNIENKKILDNKINKVSIKEENITNKKTTNVIIPISSTTKNFEVYPRDFFNEQTKSKVEIQGAPGPVCHSNYAYVLCQVELGTYRVEIPDIFNKELITKIRDYHIDSEKPINFKLFGFVNKCPFTAKVNIRAQKDTNVDGDYAFGELDRSTIHEDIEKASSTLRDVPIEIPFGDFSVTSTEINDVQAAIASIYIPDSIGNYQHCNVLKYDEKNRVFSGDVVIPAKAHIYTAKGHLHGILPSLFIARGEHVDYNATRVEFEFFGTTIFLDIKENDITYEDPDIVGSPISFSDVNLSQDGNYIDKSTPSQEVHIPLSIQNSKDIIRAYANGKETATIKCSLGTGTEKRIYMQVTILDFGYDKLPEIRDIRFNLDARSIYDIFIDFRVNDKIQTVCVPAGEIQGYLRGIKAEDEYSIQRVYYKPLLFEIGDIVQPMVYTKDGDIPMSTNKEDGTPKTFRVTGVEVTYDGTIFQKLTLQETKSVV